MPISAWKPCQGRAIRSKPSIVSYRGRAFAPRSKRWCSRRTSSRRAAPAGSRLMAMLMFRMLVLQALNNLSDEQVEYQVRDRLSFSRFLGLAIEDSIPGPTPPWLVGGEVGKG